MSWYLAPTLARLRDEINTKWPGRDLASDGSIGDARHRRSKSDHNPDANGRVDAIDVDENPARGSTDEDVGEGLWEFLRTARPKQLKYAIYEGQIMSSYPKGDYEPYSPRPYSGVNPHEGHIHISVLDEFAESTKSWGLARVPKKASPKKASKEFDVAFLPTLKRGMRSENVRVLQHILSFYSAGTKPDGIFGPDTERQVRNAQANLKVEADGIVGPKTWGAILRAK